MKRIRQILTSRKGGIPIEAAVAVLVLMSLLATALSTFQVVGMKDEADRIADALLETATYYGGFGSEFDQRVAQLQAQYFDFEVSYDATWYNHTYKRVQLGDPLSLTITITATLNGFATSIPIKLPVHRSGASERYWK